MRISDWSSDVCSSDLKPCAWPGRISLSARPCSKDDISGAIKRFTGRCRAASTRKWSRIQHASSSPRNWQREQRHKRMGDSRYVVEPNVKEGKGGLRDLHTLFWSGKYVHRVRSENGSAPCGEK